jgi:hypothetical protein
LIDRIIWDDPFLIPSSFLVIYIIIFRHIQLYSTSAGYSGNGVKKGVSRAEEALNYAQKALKEAQEILNFYKGILSQNLEMLDQWKAANPECTGEEVRFKFLKGEVESARASVDTARASFDSARASVDTANTCLITANSLYQKHTGKGNYPSGIAFVFNN